MVQVNITRQNVEILGDEGAVCGVTRQAVQVGLQNDDAGQVNVTRQSVEVLAPEPDIPSVTRQAVQVGLLIDATEQVNITRQSVEVLAAPDAASAVTRQAIQVGLQNNAPAQVNITRQSIEALARQGSAGPVTPLALADDAYVFLHNWATQARMRTSFRTNISASPDSGAESRRGLGVKPTRTLDLEWTICDPETTSGVGSLEELERLEVFLRRLTDQRFQVPIYMDQQELAVSYTSGDSTVFIDTSLGRYFDGGRVAIVQLDACNQPVSFSFHIIASMENDRLNFDSTLGVDVAAGSYVFPMMDCEVMLAVEANYITARVPSVKMTVIEAPGASQLPPIKSDNPTGASLAHDDRPVWYEEPDWSRGITKGRSRQGGRQRGGRADFVNIEGDRSRQTHKFQVTGNRETTWRALEFFETRRGRLRSFWHIDQDQYMEPIDVDTAGGTFVSISQNTLDLADTQEELQGEAVGIVLDDGTHIVRDVSTVSAVLTVYRITCSTTFQTGITLDQIHRIARARLVRFATDEFQEIWEHTGYCEAGINIIECLNEQDFTV